MEISAFTTLQSISFVAEIVGISIQMTILLPFAVCFKFAVVLENTGSAGFLLYPDLFFGCADLRREHKNKCVLAFLQTDIL